MVATERLPLVPSPAIIGVPLVALCLSIAFEASAAWITRSPSVCMVR